MIRLITLTALVFTLFSTITTAQTIECTTGCKLEWDPPSDTSDIAEYQLFLYPDQGSYSPAMTPVGSVPVGTHEWEVSVPDGEYYAVATSTDAAGNRSIPSNEVNFVFDTAAPPPPVNLRIIVTVTESGHATVEIQKK